MKGILYFLIAFVLIAIGFSILANNSDYAVIGIVMAAIVGVLCGLLKPHEA